MNKKKTIRKLNHLIGKYIFPYNQFIYILNYDPEKLLGFRLKIYNDIQMIFDLFNRLKISSQDRQIYIQNIHRNRLIIKKKYSNSPKRERKDNKDTINYGSGSSCSSNQIRFPKKKRKTAWKRFKKLFPKYDDKICNKIEKPIIDKIYKRKNCGDQIIIKQLPKNDDRIIIEYLDKNKYPYVNLFCVENAKEFFNNFEEI